MSIEVNRLLKRYGSQHAVNDISFRVAPGEIVGFLGPNGAGKSTTMKIITGFLQPDSGDAMVAGIDVIRNPQAAKQKIGYLPESNALYYDMYIREYLHFIASVHRIDNPKSAADKVIAQVGLKPEKHKLIGQLSKGYKQRVGLAAALIHDPEVLVLDEPTTGLDPNQIIEIREVIKSLGRDKTILFSSHILSEVEELCKRVIIINKGNLVADDRIDALQGKDRHTELLSVQFEKPVDPGIIQSLNGELLLNADGRGFQLKTTNAEEAKKQVLELSLQHNLNIVSLQSGDHRLEEVFRQLTSNDTVTADS